MRSLALSRDDLLRRAVIRALMCRGHIEFDAIGELHAIDFRRNFATEFATLGPLVAQGLVRLSDHYLAVTEQGWFVVRAVAMVFDACCSANRALLAGGLIMQFALAGPPCRRAALRGYMRGGAASAAVIRIVPLAPAGHGTTAAIAMLGLPCWWVRGSGSGFAAPAVCTGVGRPAG